MMSSREARRPSSVRVNLVVVLLAFWASNASAVDLLKQQTYWTDVTTANQRATDMVLAAGFPSTGYCTLATAFSASAPAGWTSASGWRCQQTAGIPASHPECNGVWCYYEAYKYTSCPSAYPYAGYPVTGQCSTTATSPGTDGTPSDYECSYYTGKSYKQYSPWGAPSKVLDCSPAGCGLATPTYDTSAQSFIVVTYAYTGQNCADHSKTPTLTPDITKPTYTGTKIDNTVTNVIDNSTGAVTSSSTSTSTTITTTQGGVDQALLDAISGISGGGSGATAGDIATALTDPDDATKLPAANYEADAEAQIAATEGDMDTYSSGVGNSDGVGAATNDPGYAGLISGFLSSGTCADYNMTVRGHTLSITCGDTALWRSILAFFLYAGTVVGIFYMFTERPGATT